jgi:hypothetical protein
MTTLDAKAHEISPQPTRSTTWRDNRLTIAHRLEHHARSRPDGRAFSFLEDGDGRMVGGLRAIGPLRSADDSHAVVEWAGQPGQQAVRDMITDRIPFGVLEMKTGWVVDDPDRNPSLTTVLARSPFHIAGLLGFQFFMATAATYVLNRWRSSGGVVAPIPATPYPNDRYQTKMI